jgi:hypothetical protein
MTTQRTLASSVRIEGPTGPINFVFITMEELGFESFAPAHLFVRTNFCKEWSEEKLAGQAIEFPTEEEAMNVREQLRKMNNLRGRHIVVFSKPLNGDFKELHIAPNEPLHHWAHDRCRNQGATYGNATVMYRLVTR